MLIDYWGWKEGRERRVEGRERGGKEGRKKSGWEGESRGEARGRQEEGR